MQNIVTVEDEFQRNPELKSEDLQSLKEWCANHTRPILPKIGEKQLIIFLHSCYFNLEKTKRCIVRYYEIRANSPDFFTCRDVRRPELQKALTVLRSCIFTARDPHGNVILFHRLNITEPSEYVFCNSVKLLSMVADSASYLNGTVPGFVFVLDTAGVRMGHLMRMSFFALRRMFQYIQEAIPVRLKAVHILNTGPVIEKLLIIAKPFIQRHLYSLLHFHSGDNSTLYEYLPKSCLPSDYGGDHESVDEMHEKCCKMLEDMLFYFEEEETLRRI